MGIFGLILLYAQIHVRLLFKQKSQIFKRNKMVLFCCLDDVKQDYGWTMAGNTSIHPIIGVGLTWFTIGSVNNLLMYAGTREREQSTDYPDFQYSSIRTERLVEVSIGNGQQKRTCCWFPLCFLQSKIPSVFDSRDTDNDWNYGTPK